MLVKDFLESFDPDNGSNIQIEKGFKVTVFEGDDQELCKSRNHDWLLTTFGWRVISSWSISPANGIVLKLKNGAEVAKRVDYRTGHLKKPNVFTTTIGTGKTVSSGQRSLSDDSSNDDVLITKEILGVNADKALTNEEFLKSLKTQEPSKYDEWDIRSLKIGTRVLNRLAENGIHSVGDLRELSKRDLRDFNGLGYRGIKQLENRLKQLGLGFKKGE